MELETIDCPLCGDVGTRPYHEENGYRAVACRGCGLVFVRERPSEAAMKHLYEGQETKIDLGRQIRNVEGTTAEARSSLALVARHVPSGGRLLEIGCAAGYFLREAARRGLSPVGVDITRQFVDFARDVLGVDAREGTLASVELVPRSFDVVYHRNVLSHLAYPVAAFERMRELLVPGGVVVFETGNVAELPGERWAGTRDLDLPDHLFHFGQAQIERLLDRTGFDVVEVQRFALVLHDPWARALSRRLARAPRPKAPDRAPFEAPRRAPRPRLGRRIGAAFEVAVQYGLGAIVPATGRRCTLRFVARART